MATPEIIALDQALSRAGQMVTLRRGLKNSIVSTRDIPAVVRGYLPSDILPGSAISQNDSKVIISPTDLRSWPGGIPAKGDFVAIDSIFRAILSVGLLSVANVLVRIELQVKG